MDFDPLELFTPADSSIKSESPVLLPYVQASVKVDLVEVAESTQEPLFAADQDETVFVPLHVHDLPLLRMKPPSKVLLVFLKLLAPLTVHNFDPPSDSEKDTAATFKDKSISVKDAEEAVAWLHNKSRFTSLELLAAVASLADVLRKSFASQYNGWLTAVISSDMDWLTLKEKEDISTLAALRLAENCGRTAQPEFIRHIEIPGLPQTIYLKEPSLTADKLGLKTWGSLFILGKRLAARPSYLNGSVLELGSGTGLVGMVSCLLGYRTVLTDLPEILPNLTDNIELNNIDNASSDSLDWSDPSEFLQRYGLLKFTTIILSDPLYSSKHPAWIVNMMNEFLEDSSDASVLLQVPIRKTFEKERAHLWALLEENGYVVQEEDNETGYDDFGETTFVFKQLARRKRD
uniref:Uncharacterized protein n=1 Tax=Candidozyma auris TaxID=498019 RepID=A0A0L0P9C5_CANAR